jgi:alanine racemase
MLKTTSVIELNRNALKKNITFLKDLFGTGVRFSSVVKGNAYGHGFETFIPIAEEAGVDHFSVFSGDEAMKVCNAASNNPEVMVMGWLDNDEMEWAVENGISFWIFELSRMEKAIGIAKKVGSKAKIHLEIETGMNRTGLSSKDFKKAISMLSTHQHLLEFEGLCTHFAGAESVANFVRVKKQINRFNKIYNALATDGITPKYRHAACSAAALTYPKTRMDMVRVGIAQYGLWPNVETFIKFIHGNESRPDPLQRVISWKSKVMSIKKVKEGEFISYGTTYLAQEEKRIAIVPVGYSHGFSRALSNQGRVLIGGNRVAVIGMVNMNMLIADISFIPEVEIGDEVVLIGKQGDLEISIASFSEVSSQVNYELLVRLPHSIKREIIN